MPENKAQILGFIIVIVTAILLLFVLSNKALAQVGPDVTPEPPPEDGLRSCTVVELRQVASAMSNLNTTYPPGAQPPPGITTEDALLMAANWYYHKRLDWYKVYVPDLPICAESLVTQMFLGVDLANKELVAAYDLIAFYRDAMISPAQPTGYCT